TRFFAKLLKGLRSVPQMLVTDKLVSHGGAHRRLKSNGEHRGSKYLNNRHRGDHRRPGRDAAGSPTGARLPRRPTIVTELGLADRVELDFPEQPDWSLLANPEVLLSQP